MAADRTASDPSLDEASGVLPGDCLGRYTVKERLGAGGVGEVFAAHDPELDRLVAVKVLRAGLAGESPEARTRFQREAQAMARLNHPNVVSVYDVGMVGDHVFVAMERVEGPTMAAWLAERARGWREVVDVFLQAGRGLEAAHAAGIVHRDFKPSNVIIGDRVRVADFGLARAVLDPESLPAPAMASALDGDVTHTGAMVGTPAYMAPEQREGLPAGPLSDQYAFGVALHEALVGTRPGVPAASPPRAVPRSLRAVTARALAPRPQDRYPSMRALLADLARDPARVRRRVIAAAAVVAVVAGVLIGRQKLAAPLCAGAEDRIAPVWDDVARARVRRAFAATGRPYAEDTFARVDTALRAHQVAWARAHTDACEATHVRHEQSEALLDARMRCLGRVRAEMTALVAVLARADLRAMDRAAQATAGAGNVDACAGDAVLEAVPPPREPERAAQVETARQDLARLSALRRLDHDREAYPLARELVQRTRAIDHAPVLAEALVQLGGLEVQLGHLDHGIDLLYQGMNVAAVAHAEVMHASALVGLFSAIGMDQQRFEAGEVLFRAACAAITRVGRERNALYYDIYSKYSSMLDRKGSYEVSLAAAYLALAFAEQAYGPDSMEVSASQAMIAGALASLGRTDQALPLFDHSVETAEHAVGRRHQVMPYLLHNAGALHADAGDYAGGEALLRRALAVAEETLGPDDLAAAWPCKTLSALLVETGRLPEARVYAERALRIRAAKLGADSPETAEAQEGLGVVALASGQAAEAHELFSAALAVERKVYAEANARIANLVRYDAVALRELGRLAEAHAAAGDAMAIDQKLVGTQRRNYDESLDAMASILCAEGRCPEAVPLYRHALAILEADVGPRSVLLAGRLTGLCTALLGAGDAAAARAAAVRALEVGATAPDGVRAEGGFCLAQAEWATPGDRGGALKRAREVRARLAALPAEAKLLARVDAWLASRPR